MVWYAFTVHVRAGKVLEKYGIFELFPIQTDT